VQRQCNAGMSFFSETAKSGLQKALYDLLKAAVVAGVTWAAQRWLSNRATAMNAPGAVLWASLVSLVLAFGLLFLFDSWRVKKSVPVRRIRVLEYHAMHLLWMRARLLDKTTTEPQVKDAERVIEKHRAQLLDTTPGLFPQSAVDGFRKPAMLVLTAALSVVKGLPNESDRAGRLASLDHLLRAIRVQWEYYDGMRTAKP
jgi:hypothetical protein